MSLLLAAAVGVLTACGVYLALRARTFAVVLGVMLLGYAANLFLLAMGRTGPTRPPILGVATAGDPRGAPYADPVPQALVLTAIVISFGMTAYLVALALRAVGEQGDDRLDPPDRHASGEEKDA